MRLDREENVEVARRTAAHARLALAAEPDARAVLDAGGNIDRQRALARHAPGAGAFVARIVDRLAAAVTGRTGALDGEEALLRANAAVARAGLAGGGLRARPRAGARAGLADHRGRQLDRRGLAAERLLEGDLEIVAQVGAALAAAGLPAASAAHHVAEQVLEDVGHRGGEAVVHARLARKRHGRSGRRRRVSARPTGADRPR